MSNQNQAWKTRDLAAIWHPCTQMKDHEQLPMIPIQRGEGIWLYDFEGNRYLDAISSWWVNIFGHCNPRINAALKQQLEQLEHVILAGFTHQAAIELAERLIQLAPPGLAKCFFADNGSSAIEVALKMSFHYWLNTGKKEKTKFITLANSYHGETLGALAVGDVDLYKKTYAPLLMQAITAPSPDCYFRENGESWESYSIRQFEKMKLLLEKHAHETCAVIIEPLVQCAGSMRMYHPVYLKLLREACNEYGVHLIADEIAVGFGRTGTLFACEQANITPDYMCLSKGLTAGYLPLSVVLTTQNIYEAFYDEYNTLKAFLHSHSYTGNPIGCRAALATLDIFQYDNIIENNKPLISALKHASLQFENHAHVSEVRQTGMIVAIEMVKNKQTREPFDWTERRGIKAYEYALSKGALLRPLGNVMYFMPPYIITAEQINWLSTIAHEAIDYATR